MQHVCDRLGVSEVGGLHSYSHIFRNAWRDTLFVKDRGVPAADERFPQDVPCGRLHKGVCKERYGDMYVVFQCALSRLESFVRMRCELGCVLRLTADDIEPQHLFLAYVRKRDPIVAVGIRLAMRSERLHVQFRDDGLLSVAMLSEVLAPFFTRPVMGLRAESFAIRATAGNLAVMEVVGMQTREDIPLGKQIAGTSRLVAVPAGGTDLPQALAKMSTDLEAAFAVTQDARERPRVLRRLCRPPAVASAPQASASSSSTALPAVLPAPAFVHPRLGVSHRLATPTTTPLQKPVAQSPSALDRPPAHPASAPQAHAISEARGRVCGHDRRGDRSSARLGCRCSGGCQTSAGAAREQPPRRRRRRREAASADSLARVATRTVEDGRLGGHLQRPF